MSVRRETLYRILLVSASIAGTLLVCELGVRVQLALSDPGSEDFRAELEVSERALPKRDVGNRSLRGLVRPSRDPEIIYELKPNITGRFVGQEFSISAQGLRDREYSVAKPAGTFRIVGLGDSVTFGWGVPQSETYLEVLERRLSSSRQPVEVLNFGVPGYNTAMEVATFERKALAFDPDLVILNFVENDLRLPAFLQPPRRVWSLDKSHLWELVARRWGRLSQDRRPRLRAFSDFPEDEAPGARRQVLHMLRWEGFERAIEKLSALTRPRSLPVIVVTLGTAEEPWATARRIAEARGLRVLSMEPVYSRYLSDQGLGRTPEAWARAFWLSPDDPHPSVLGHRLHAEALAPEIEAYLYGGDSPRDRREPRKP